MQRFHAHPHDRVDRGISGRPPVGSPGSTGSTHRTASGDAPASVDQLHVRVPQVEVALPNEQEDTVLDVVVEEAAHLGIDEPGGHGGGISDPAAGHRPFVPVARAPAPPGHPDVPLPGYASAAHKPAGRPPMVAVVPAHADQPTSLNSVLVLEGDG